MLAMDILNTPGDIGKPIGKGDVSAANAHHPNVPLQILIGLINMADGSIREIPQAAEIP